MGRKKGKRVLEKEKKPSKKNEKIEKANKKEKTKKNKKEKKKKKSKGNNTGIKIVIIMLLILAIIGGIVFAYKIYQNGGGLTGVLATAMGHDENTKKNLPEFRVLLMGISTDLESKLTDTIIVASYNPSTQKATMLSIPRDTFVGKSEKRATGSDKINALYAVRKGPKGTLSAVNEITGLDIKYYAVVETEALIKLVDEIGPVTFNVPIDMKYDDPTQDLHINLKAGEQEIDGEKAEQLLRFRKNNNGTSYPSEYGDNDIGRMRTQREFISETMRQTLKIQNIGKLGKILDIAKESIETNIDFKAAKDYIPYLVEFNTENLVSDNLPGQPILLNELWFFKADKTATADLVDRLFPTNLIGVEKPTGNTTNTTNTTKKTTSSKTKTAENKDKDELKIQVVNGTGATEKYEQAITALKEAGFKVEKPKKTGVESSRTIITNQNYVNQTIIDEIKTILKKGDVSNNTSSSSGYDLTITIGKDY